MLNHRLNIFKKFPSFQQERPSLQTKDIPYDIIWTIMWYLTLLDITKLARVDRHFHEAVISSRWEYGLPRQYNIFHSWVFYDVENPEIFHGTFQQLSKDMSCLKNQLNSREYEIRKETFRLNIIGDPNSAHDEHQMKAACAMGVCGCLCGCCLPGLWSSQFLILPSTILGTLLGIGCFFQVYSEEEKCIEKITHESRYRREAPIRKRIADERKNISDVRIKFFPPLCTLKSVNHEIKSNLIKRKYKV